MRIVATPMFSGKLRGLRQGSQVHHELVQLLRRVEATDKQALLSSSLLATVGNDVLVLRGRAGIRVFCTFFDDPDGEALLLLDLSVRQEPSGFRTNPTTNPRSNPTINPFSNPTINPRSNPTINPRSNRMINPRSNITYSGPFVYNLDLDQIGFGVRANDRILLLFDNDAEFIGFGVLHGGDGYATFDSQSEWTGHLVSDRRGHYLQFDLDNEWIGIVI